MVLCMAWIVALLLLAQIVVYTRETSRLKTSEEMAAMFVGFVIGLFAWVLVVILVLCFAN